MSAMRFSMRAQPGQRLDLSPLVSARLAGVQQAAIERLPLQTTRAALCVGDVFRLVMGDVADIVIEGGSDRFDSAGEGMDGGSLRLEGDVGLRAGRRMTGGRLEIRGSAGHWAASGLRGGDVVIEGDTGDWLGAPLGGERAGMAGGTVVVRGRAGTRVGDRMRRGMIVVEGNAGEAVGSQMIAGTVIVCGQAGPMAGILMRRGTLVLGQEPVSGLLPTFARCGGDADVFVRLLAGVLRPVSEPAAALADRALARFAGDMATLGRGELFLFRP